MKFKSNSVINAVEIVTLEVGDTFIDLNNFNETEVFMVITTDGYDCTVRFDDGFSSIAAINLTSGEMWAYKRNEEVIPVEIGEVIYNRL